MLLPFLIAGCGGEEEAPKAPPNEKVEAAAAPAPAAPADDQPVEPGGEDAAAVLKSYYGMIEARKYDAAWKLRWPSRGDSREAFAEAYSRYAEYRANVGAPSEPVEANGSWFVEVPVQLYGRMKSGEPFGSAGSVTLRRPKSGGGWRIYSG
ncbi:MAG TPA: hypothetical protein VNT25_05535 [Allosphingosinicella sp.]|nr:hypothetical protein [Allosphingosinicella sp.]